MPVTQQKSRAIAKKDVKELITKFYQTHEEKCPVCGGLTDALVISNGSVCCPACHEAEKKFHITSVSAKNILDRYYKGAGGVNCPYCGKRTDSIIITRGNVCCPYCQKLNWLDLVSLVGKTPDGVAQTFVVACHYKDDKHRENNTIIKGPKESKIRFLLNKISFGKVQRKVKFGYMKIFINPKVLRDAKEFDKKYFVTLGATPKELIAKYFGDVQATVTDQVRKYEERSKRPNIFKRLINKLKKPKKSEEENKETDKKE